MNGFEFGIIWGAIGIIFVILEIISVIFFPVFFAVGAFSAAIFSCFSGNWAHQILVFAVASTVTALIGKPLLQKFYKVNKVTVKACAVHSLIGSTGMVTMPISSHDVGQIKVDDAVWCAGSEDEEFIEKGAKVEIISVEGVKLIVKLISK